MTENGFSVKFSEEDRARTLNIHRDDVQGFLTLLRDAQEAGAKMVAAAQAAPAKPAK